MMAPSEAWRIAQKTSDRRQKLALGAAKVRAVQAWAETQREEQYLNQRQLGGPFRRPDAEAQPR